MAQHSGNEALAAETDVSEAAVPEPAPDHASAPGSSSRLLELVALAEQEPELGVLLPYLSDPAPAVRREAVAVLTETLPSGTGPALAEALRDPAAAVRSAARAVEALTDPAWQVRAGAATALAVAHPETAVPVLAKALADPNADVRKAAVLALTRLHASEAARAALATATTDPDADVRAYAGRAL